MYIFHFILLLVFLAASYAIFYKFRQHKYVDAAMLVVIIATVVANGIATAEFFSTGSLDVRLYMLQALLSCMIVPSSYAYVSHVLGNKAFNGTTLATASLILLMLAPNISVIETISHQSAPGSYDFIVPHSLNFIRGGRNVFHMTVEGVVIVLQALIVLRRIIILDVQMHRYELVYTNKMRALITWAISCAVFAIIYHSLPAHTWAGSSRAWVYFAVYAVLGVSGFLGIAMNMEFRTIVTREGAEAVQMDRFIQGNKELSRRMRDIFEKDNIFLRQGITIDDVVSALGTNRTYFTRMMRAEFGMSFTEYVQCERVKYCKKSLRDGDASLESIAFDSGFGSASSLTRVFKKVTGQTPDEFRKRCR